MTTPVVVSTWYFSLAANTEAARLLREGTDALDSVEKGIRVCEDDPEADTVGYGGVPNTDGIVELDAALMYGPGKRIGCVAGLRGIAEAVSVARLVMEITPHALMVGGEAQKLALANGFAERDLLTEKALKQWQEWRQGLRPREGHDTIGMVALDSQGNLCAGTSTSGVKFKMPGRVGDSPIVGSGLYADNDVGAAVATGQGEHIIPYCVSFRIVEEMRRGTHPAEACVNTIEWVMSDRRGMETGMIGVIALAKDGSWGCYASRAGFSCYASAGAEAPLLVESRHYLP